MWFLTLLACLSDTLHHPAEGAVQGREPGEDASRSALQRVKIIVPDDDPTPLGAWLRAQVQLGLARLPGMVPVLEDGLTGPGRKADEEATLDVRLIGDDLHLTWCDDTCVVAAYPWTRSTPSVSLDHVFEQLTDQLGLQHDWGAFDDPRDDYTWTLAKRSMAVREVRPVEHSGDRRRDPQVRSLFLPPDLVGTP